MRLRCEMLWTLVVVAPRSGPITAAATGSELPFY